MGREKKSELSKFKLYFEDIWAKRTPSISRQAIHKYYVDRRNKRRSDRDSGHVSKFRKVINKFDSIFNWILS